jgi:hypothetical protein
MYDVWDTINGSENEAAQIYTLDPFEAAKIYAQADRDGLIDGLYDGARAAHPIAVKDEDGTVFIVSVWAELEPVWYGQLTSTNPPRLAAQKAKGAP